MTAEWTNISGPIQGDIQYSLRTTAVSNTHIYFSLTSYSEKWEDFDVSFEYRASKVEEWERDAFLASANVERIIDNKIIGIKASQYGEINSFSWEYAKNSIVYGETFEVKVSILPRVRHFSTSGVSHAVSQAFAESLAQIDGIASTVKIIGVNNSGKYICSSDIALFIRNEPEGPNILQYSSFGKITHAIQTPNGEYIISDSLSGLITELDSTMTTVLKSFSCANVEHFDYNSEEETILVTRKSDNLIEEYSWADGGYGTLLWASAFIISSPESATYKADDASRLVIADANNRIGLVSKVQNSVQWISRYHFYEIESSEEEITNFYKPFRVFWTGDNIYIIEKEGKILTFDDFSSSSSSL